MDSWEISAKGIKSLINILAIRVINAKMLYNVFKGNAVFVTGRVETCETSRHLLLLDSRLTDRCKLISLTRRPLFTPPTPPKEDFRYSFLWKRLSRTQSSSAAGRIR
jgi:hypothetical protein